MNEFLLVLSIMGGILGVSSKNWTEASIEHCAFYREGKCLSCDETEAIPVGYKENCDQCPNRVAIYVAEGFVSAWQCVLSENGTSEMLGTSMPVEISQKKCPQERPLQDIVGNCYSCESEEPVRIGYWKKERLCGTRRYFVPDDLVDKSEKCPEREEILDAEMCFHCGGIPNENGCDVDGFAKTCTKNDDCASEAWCYPLKMTVSSESGFCTPKTREQWICSETDGYTQKTAKEFCERQGAHLPSLQEIEEDKEKALVACPTNDMWTFFSPDGAVWLESFDLAFLFTREGETDKIGGHSFYALCHKN